MRKIKKKKESHVLGLRREREYIAKNKKGASNRKLPKMRNDASNRKRRKYYVHVITKNIVSIPVLDTKGFSFSIKNNCCLCLNDMY